MYANRFIGIFLALILFLFQCTYDTVAVQEEALSIKVRWLPSYPAEDIEAVKKGVLWSLSFMGASLPTSSFNLVFQETNDNKYLLDLEKAGFSSEALKALQEIIQKIKASEEYKRFDSVDLGRFLTLTLHSSYHYYKITNTPEKIEDFENQYLGGLVSVFPVVQSSVSSLTRVIRFGEFTTAPKIGFVADETDDENLDFYTAKHYEVLRVLPNGQLSFAIYDAAGKLLPFAPLATTNAGKPSKCLWCHETNIQPLFRETPEVPGFLSRDAFLDKIEASNELLQNYRKQLSSDLNFDQQADHTFSELLYITFMEPSLKRIAQEWDMPEAEAETLLKDLPTHRYGEFDFLGALYFRQWVDALAPFNTLPVPESVREPNLLEPNFFK